MADLDKILQQRLSVLSNEYISQLESKLHELKQLWSNARFGLCNSDEIRESNRLLQDLVSSGTTFGLNRTADTAHKLELFFTSLLNGAGLLAEEHRWQSELLLQSLEHAILNRHNNLQKPKQNRWEPAGIFPGIDDRSRVIFILENDETITAQLTSHLQQCDYHIETYNNIQALKLAMEKDLPAAIITSQLLQDKEALGNRLLLKNMYGFKAEIPIIFISLQDNIESRLQAVRSGSAYYFTMPLDLNSLANKLDELTTGVPKDPYRVMVVDDDKVISNFYALILEQEGMTVTVVNEPAETLKMINKSSPELILLDIYMPNCSGLELTTIIRQQEKYAGISVVLLSTEADYGRQLAAKNLGGDDFLTKPVDPDYLIATISSRVYRARTLNTMTVNLLTTMRELESQQFALDQHAIVSITNIHGYIIYVNDKFCDISGYSRAELIGKDHKILNSGHHDKSFFAQTWEKISRGEVWQGEICNKTKNGDLYWVNVTIVPFMDEEKRPYQYVAINSDITSRILAEQYLLKARDVAVTANQAKSEFLSKMSHELRTPLNAVMGFSQLLESSPDKPLSDTQSQYIKEIHNAGEHLLSLINEVLDLSRIEADQLKVENINIPLSSFLDECAALIMPTAKEKGISIKKHYKNRGNLAVLADPVRLKQVMVNLLSNAVKYNIHDGGVDIRIDSETAGTINIEVINSGYSIRDDQIKLLFQPFSRLPQHKNQEGTGIGLALCKRLVELMGGKIGVDSHIDKGTRFWIELKQTTSETDEHRDRTRQVKSRRKNPKKQGTYTILYIEDNITNFTLVKEILGQRPNMKLLHAETAEAGVKIAETKMPDMVLMDLNLPGMDGLDALKVLRNNSKLKTMPVLAVSAYASTENIQRAISEGFDEYITKPIEITSFLATIDAVADRGTVRHL